MALSQVIFYAFLRGSQALGILCNIASISVDTPSTTLYYLDAIPWQQRFLM